MSPWLGRTLGLSLVPLLGAALAHGQSAPEGAFQLCLAGAADGSCVYPTQVVPAPATAVFVAFPLRAGQVEKLTAKLTVLDVGGAIPANSVISQQEARPSKNDTRALLGFMGPPLPLGKYRVDVAADGKPLKPVEFAVLATSKPHEVKRPDDLMPLAQGTAWTYAVVQAGKAPPGGPTPSIGRKIDLSGVAPDGEGARRATVTVTAAGPDPAGTRIEVRRAGTGAYDEWWRVDERGWAVTQRRGPLGIAKVDPPQVLLPMPLTGPREWTYDALRQKFRMWGPVPVRGPRGDAPGYVVLVEQPQELSMKETVEWHVVPGVGLAREVTIIGSGAQTVSRSELVLQSVR